MREMRLVSATVSLILLSCLFNCGLAFSATGFEALDDAAIQVKAPGEVPLVAITSDGTKLIAVGVHGVIALSSDNGVSWTQASVPVNLTVTGVYFASPKKGWATGHYGVVLETNDGGRSWKKVIDGLNVIDALNAVAASPPVGSSDADAQLSIRVAKAFQRAGPNKPFLTTGSCGGGVLAAGQQDIAMFSDNDGNTWKEWTSQINNPQFYNIYDILNDGASTLLVGEGGLVLKGDSSCRNFNPVPGPYTGTLFGGLVLKPGKFFVFGITGGLFRTDDDGRTWKTIPMPSDAVITSAVVLHSGVVLLATLGGSLYLSDPGADQFHELPLSVPFQISDLAAASDGNVIAVGNGGVEILPSQILQ